jgi:hypothetical protein
MACYGDSFTLLYVQTIQLASLFVCNVQVEKASMTQMVYLCFSFFSQNNGPNKLGSIKCSEVLEQLHNWQLVKNGSTA